MYRIETYDPADDSARDGEWSVVAEGLGLWDVRRWLRDLYRRGYSVVSVYLCREDGETSRRHHC